MIFLTALVIWTYQVNQTGWLENGMLDTFDNHIQMQANVPISVAVMTMPNYGRFWMDYTWGQYVIFPLQNLLGKWIYINPPMYHATETYNSSGAYNSIDFWFNESAGCGDYVYLVYVTSGNPVPFHLIPNVTAVYNPAPKPTGICSG
jgi:hypothetical protein